MGFNIFIFRCTVRIENVKYLKGGVKKWCSSIVEEIITSERGDLDEGFAIWIEHRTALRGRFALGKG